MTFEQAVECFEKQIIVVGRKNINYHNTVEKSGLITKRPEKCSGVWGYGGDSVAIYIGKETFPLKGCEINSTPTVK